MRPVSEFSTGWEHSSKDHNFFSRESWAQDSQKRPLLALKSFVLRPMVLQMNFSDVKILGPMQMGLTLKAYSSS